jgi:hypothetical protein
VILPDASVAASTGGVGDTHAVIGFAPARGSAKVDQAPGAIRDHADVAQLVAHHLAKVRVASSSLVIRSSAGIATRRNPEADHDTWVEPHTVAWPSG